MALLVEGHVPRTTVASTLAVFEGRGSWSIVDTTINTSSQMHVCLCVCIGDIQQHGPFPTLSVRSALKTYSPHGGVHPPISARLEGYPALSCVRNSI